MRVHSLELTNVGPFDEARLEFRTDGPAVTFVTGENGTGKSIVIDAIRGMFGHQFGSLERAIWRSGEDFKVTMLVQLDAEPARWVSATLGGGAPGKYVLGTPLVKELAPKLGAMATGGPEQVPSWVVDFWRSGLASDPYEITSLVTPDPRQALTGALSGTARNAAATEALCFFDYLRGSSEQQEKRIGEALFEATRKIIEVSLLDGRFIHIDRRSLTPYVMQSGHRVPLRNLSSGNAYLIQRLLGLLVRMYGIHTLRQTEPETICETPGLLLIDEAENHLHPRWQKRLIPDILSIFPNLQIIATTHSPFVLASVEGARVYVCRYERERHTCVVDDATADYASKPVDEILVSPAFDFTQPFSKEITDLIEARKAAIEAGDRPRQQEIEAKLLEENPEYFAYFQIDERLRLLAGGGR